MIRYWLPCRGIEQSSFGIGSTILTRSSGTDVELPVLTETPPTGGNGSHFYRLTFVGISTTTTSDVIGKITLNKVSATSVAGVSFNIPTDAGGITPMTGLGWKGLVKTGQVNYTVTVSAVASTAMDITGPVNADTLSTLQTEGQVTSSGQIIVGTAPNGCIIRAAAGIEKATSGNSVSVLTASGNLLIESGSTGDILGSIVVSSTNFSASQGFRVESGRNIGGDITVPNGELRLVSAAGDIVNPAEFSSGQSWDSTPPADTVAAPTRLTISARDGIYKIVANRIAAHINADSDNSGSGVLINLQATGTSPSGSAGLYGTVKAHNFYNTNYSSGDPTTSAIYVAGIQKSVIS